MDSTAAVKRAEAQLYLSLRLNDVYAVLLHTIRAASDYRVYAGILEVNVIPFKTFYKTGSNRLLRLRIEDIVSKIKLKKL